MYNRSNLSVKGKLPKYLYRFPVACRSQLISVSVTYRTCVKATKVIPFWIFTPKENAVISACMDLDVGKPKIFQDTSDLPMSGRKTMTVGQHRSSVL
ncbi:hypothetical protein ACLB2K_063417 [Fragaria x ananassa]